MTTPPVGDTKKVMKISRWKIVGVIVLLIIVVLGLIFYKLIGGVLKYKPEAEQDVTALLTAASKDDVDGVYSVISSQFKQTYTKDQISKLLQANKYRFSGFSFQKSTTFKGFNSTEYKNTIYEYEGDITYSDGFKGHVTAKLVSEDGVLKIMYINVDTDPKRLNKF